MRATRVLMALAGLACLWATTAAGRAEETRLGDLDQKFVKGATSGGKYEVKSSELAADRAGDDAAKKFAKHMIDDHTRANKELTDLLDKKKVAPPKDMREQDRANVEKLGKLKGTDFDREYWAQQLAAHKEAVALFEEEAKNGKDADLKAFAEKTLPTIREHLKMAQEHARSGADK